jgi:hypothetical protein
MVDVVVQAEGPNASDALRLAAAFFETEFGIKAQTRAVKTEEVQKGLDPAWLGVFLAIPPAVLAVMDLAERAKLVERTNAMLAQMRVRLGSAAAVIRIGAGKTFDVATVKAKEFIEAIRSADREDGH